MPSSQTVFEVRGMKCGGCIARATEALKQLPGYEGAEFDLKRGTAVVRGEVDAQAVIHALTNAGYPASLGAG